MRVLVSGGAGFIGSHLGERLLGDGAEVVAVDDLSTGRASNVAHLRASSRFTLIEHDVVEPLALEGPLDWVLHLACPASPPEYQRRPLETLRVCSDGTRRLLELARARGAAFLLASTSEVYGDPSVHPQHEGYFGNVNPIGLRSVYDEGKRYAEALTMAFHRVHAMPVRIVRIFNTYGPRMHPDDGRVVTNFITSALRGDRLTVYGDGTQTRSFQYIDDLVEGLVRVMRCAHVEPINLGNPHEHTVLELAEEVRRLVGTKSEIVFGALPEDDPIQRCPDISLAKRVLDWEPRVSLREGLEKTIEHLARELRVSCRE